MQPSARRTTSRDAASGAAVARARRGCFSSAALALLGVLGCKQPPALRVEGARVAAPAPQDLGDLCLDLADVRACWGGACGERGCVVPRPLPDAIAPRAGFRCAGQGKARSCGARSAQAGEFACDAQQCVQAHPRAPDNGEWECVDSAGAVYCRKVADAAGIEPGPLDPAFACGARPTEAGGERICVDFAPDVPNVSGSYACSSRYRGGARTWVCKPTREPRLGAACPQDGACPRGAACVSGFCLPPRPRPGCWLDADCPHGHFCSFGSCARDST